MSEQQTTEDPAIKCNRETWLEENQKFFLPPVCNKMMHSEGQIKSFFVGGPNQRKDYHIEEGEELFYMEKGDMCLKVVEQGKHKDIIIKQGQIFLLPGKIAHSPQREKDTIGLVIERERSEDEKDGLRYYIEKDGKPTLESLYEKWFQCVDLGSQLGPIIKGYFASEQHRTGKPIPEEIPENPPIILDSERKLEEPLFLFDWLVNNKEEIDEKGKKNLFGDGYQFQVDVYGKGENTDCRKNVETFIWQLEGEADVMVAERKYTLVEDDILLIKEGQKYTANRPAGSRQLICFQDPARKKK